MLDKEFQDLREKRQNIFAILWLYWPPLAS